MALAAASAHARPAFVSDFAFVMPDIWFVLPGTARNDDTLLFRRYSVAMHRAAFDATRSGKADKIDIIGPPGTFYNSMIYTCRKIPDKPDYLTFHLPPTVIPASFKYDDHKPQLTIDILADKESSRNVGEYNKGDLFLDATDAEAGNLRRLMRASDISVQFGARKDRLKLAVTNHLSRLELAKMVKEMLPLLLKVDPATLRSFTSTELREHCLAYRGAI